MFLLTFPSPYGVIFILIYEGKLVYHFTLKMSFRLLTELYSFLFWNDSVPTFIQTTNSFRLLTELYSFLLKKWLTVNIRLTVSFRLLTELYSFLC